jgi:hypothetical protein
MVLAKEGISSPSLAIHSVSLIIVRIWGSKLTYNSLDSGCLTNSDDCNPERAASIWKLNSEFCLQHSNLKSVTYININKDDWMITNCPCRYRYIIFVLIHIQIYTFYIQTNISDSDMNFCGWTAMLIFVSCQMIFQFVLYDYQKPYYNSFWLFSS